MTRALTKSAPLPRGDGSDVAVAVAVKAAVAVVRPVCVVSAAGGDQLSPLSCLQLYGRWPVVRRVNDRTATSSRSRRHDATVEGRQPERG